MKKITTIISFILLTLFIKAQSPEQFSYQAVVRNANGELVANSDIGVQISILKDTKDGEEVYTEVHNPTTNSNGLFSIEIGVGETASSFSSIAWGAASYYLKSEVDIEGGTNYTLTTVSQLLSVPYALHAKTADAITGGISETDPLFSGSAASSITNADIAKWNTGESNYTETDSVFLKSEAAKVTSTDITNLSNLSGTNTGDQDLSSLASINALKDSVAMLRNEMPKTGISGAVESDPVFVASYASKITADDLTNFDNLSGVNTGDQDLSALATFTALTDSVAKLRNEMTKTGTTGAVETDPVFIASQAVNITAEHITNLSNLSGTNSGDQDITGIETNATAIAENTTAIALNTAKTGITQDQATAIETNTAKVGITAVQASAIDANTAKTGITADQSDAIVANTAKVGITTEQANAIIANTAKVGITTAQTTKLDGIEAGAQVNVKADWNATSGDAQILNKPDLSVYAQLAAFNDLLQLVTVLELRIEVLEGTSAADLISEGATVSDLIDAGLTAADLYSGGATVPQLLAGGVSVATLLAVPVPVSEMVSGGASITDMYNAGASAADLYNGGAAIADMLTAGVPVADIYTAGASILELLTGGAATLDILAAGATTADFVGIYYQGGVIFHVDASTGYGLICAVADQSTGIEWGCNSSYVNGAEGSAIGTGKQNTIDILADCGTSGNAAAVCNDYSLTVNGVVYNDWFLPSEGELFALYTNKDAIDATATSNGGTAFTVDRYWSSTERAQGYADYVKFLDGVRNLYAKSSLLRVRAVREF